MQKCTKCNGTIVMGGEEYAGKPFCSPECISKLLVAVAEENVPPEDLEAKAKEMFRGGCPKCNAQKPIDVYSVTKMTGMLLAVSISRDEQVLCTSCARKFKLGAWLHCLFLGWWSPRAFFFNIFMVPFGLLSIIFTMEPKEPSEALRTRIKIMIGDSILTQ